MTESYTGQEIKEQQATDKFPCKGCGGNMVFDPESGALACSYCGNKVAIANENSPILEYDFYNAEENIPEAWSRGTRIIKCDSCGAETVLDVNDAAQFCAFCGSSHIIKADKDAGIPPESLVPFKINEKTAREQFTAWIKKRWLAPNALKGNYQAQRLKGVYIPCWTYDSDTSSAYTGEGGTYYYVTETRWVTENGKQVQKNVQVRKIRWWPTSGTYSEFFNDVPVYASKNIDSGLMTKLEPFDHQALVHFKPEYLSGFLAERYSLGLKDGWSMAQGFIDNRIRKGVIDQINADEVRNLHINTYYNNIRYKLLLLPVWISAYTYKSKKYTYMVNGQTGKTSGHAPVSAIKVALLTLAIIAAIALTLFILNQTGVINLNNF